MKWILKEKGITASADQYFELIGKEENVRSDEIIEAGVFPLLYVCSQFKLFIEKYYLEHGRVNGDGSTSEHMLETMTRAVQHGRAKEQYMVKALASNSRVMPSYWTRALAEDYEETNAGF